VTLRISYSLLCHLPEGYSFGTMYLV
jgi:hypothetical protein